MRKKSATPVIFNMIKSLTDMNLFSNSTLDEVFRHTKEIQSIVMQGNKDPQTTEVVKTLYSTANQLPIDDKFRIPISFSAPLFHHAYTDSSPVIGIDNQDLILMLRDTDIHPEMLRKAQLPFGEFVVCFEYKNYLFEAYIAKITIDSSYMKTDNIEGLVDGDFFYSASGFMYKSGGKKPIVELYDMDVSSTNNNFKFFSNEDKGGIPVGRQEIMLEAVKIFNGLFLYLSLPRTVEYISKKNSVIKKGVRNLKKNTQPAYLFSDIQYSYQSNSNSNGGSKKAHLVRGHFRNQPFGKRTDPEYRTQWIEPYFTGDGEAGNKEYKLN